MAQPRRHVAGGSVVGRKGTFGAALGAGIDQPEGGVVVKSTQPIGLLFGLLSCIEGHRRDLGYREAKDTLSRVRTGDYQSLIDDPSGRVLMAKWNRRERIPGLYLYLYLWQNTRIASSDATVARQGKAQGDTEIGVEVWRGNERDESLQTYFDIMACVARLRRSKPPSEAAIAGSNLQDVPPTPARGDLVA
ncbi:hypothetical protein CIB48_g6252 [Xylaria polymorpha]|nr:hypothetical protein CIB48_g6252 [Xylaria polymorpha]